MGSAVLPAGADIGSAVVVMGGFLCHGSAAVFAF